MAGLYLHIPFCRKACYYCNFHFSTNHARMDEMVQAMIHELEQRRSYLPAAPLETVYFGGGTPSLLAPAHLDALFNAIHRNFSLLPDAEITLEANPDDLDRERVAFLRSTPVNRFSLGVQSFFEADLQWMNRAHNAAQAGQSISLLKDAGFNSLSIDLIYGSPTLSDENWQANLDKATAFGIDHISSYALTVEPKTALAHLIKTGQYRNTSEEQAARQFEMLVSTLEQRGYEQYEISNFARNGKYAVHNTNYWKNKPYLGIGPSAHSFNGHSRSWNIANNNEYLRLIASGEETFETELLSRADRFNEYIMTGLRTQWGCSMEVITAAFGNELQHIKPLLEEKIKQGLIELTETGFKLSHKARLLADGIAADLFVLNNQ